MQDSTAEKKNEMKEPDGAEMGASAVMPDIDRKQPET